VPQFSQINTPGRLRWPQLGQRCCIDAADAAADAAPATWGLSAGAPGSGAGGCKGEVEITDAAPATCGLSAGAPGGGLAGTAGFSVAGDGELAGFSAGADSLADFSGADGLSEAVDWAGCAAGLSEAVG
jgi:hypothetical protein